MKYRIVPNITKDSNSDKNTPHSSFDLMVPFFTQRTNKGMVMKIQSKIIQPVFSTKPKKKEMMANDCTMPM